MYAASVYIYDVFSRRNSFARMAEWSKAADLSPANHMIAWVQTPLRASFFPPHGSSSWYASSLNTYKKGSNDFGEDLPRSVILMMCMQCTLLGSHQHQDTLTILSFFEQLRVTSMSWSSEC
jgi:hypothetical protein